MRGISASISVFLCFLVGGKANRKYNMTMTELTEPGTRRR